MYWVFIYVFPHFDDVFHVLAVSPLVTKPWNRCTKVCSRSWQVLGKTCGCEGVHRDPDNWWQPCLPVASWGMLKFPSQLPGVSTTVRGGNVSSPNQVRVTVSTSRVTDSPAPETLKGLSGNAGPEPSRRQPTEDLPTPVFPISMTTFSSPIKMTMRPIAAAPIRRINEVNVKACAHRLRLVPTARSPEKRALTCHLDSAPCGNLCTLSAISQDSSKLSCGDRVGKCS